MSRRYTAQEMREMADFIWRFTTDSHRGYFYIPNGLVFNVDDATAMLRQAADMMEREEKRERKYEFSVNPPEVNGIFEYLAGAELVAHILKLNGCSDGTIVRREVGEWEEVQGEQD